MPIYLNVSNDITELAGRLTAQVGAARRDPFLSEWVVTQTAGMNDWLKERFVADHGIAANIRFCTPDDVVAQVRHWLQPAGRQPLDREAVRWAIFGHLGGDAFQSAFPEKAAYYADSDIRRISLADEMADLFDQYQIYRAEMLEGWRSRLASGDEPTDWQEWLWAALLRQFEASHIDRVEAKRKVREMLQDPESQEIVSRRMPALHVFGVAVITPYHLEVLYVLSQFLDVHMYLVNPAPGEYWLEDSTERMLMARRRGGDIHAPLAAATLGNELLINLGRLIRESFTLLFRDQDMINLYDPVEKPPPSTDRLLHKIQRDIQGNLHGDGRHKVLEDDITDGSIVLSGSFTPLREVEALYNHLVSLVDGSPGGISPRDILVQVTDIDLYAPHIKAVFDHARYRMPYSIADRSVTADNNMFTAMQALLTLDAEQMKAEEVLEVLESPYVRSRFGISSTEDIRDAVRQAGIIYSVDGRREDDTRRISWRYGLKRILYGLCIGGGTPYGDGTDALVPLDSAEGSSATDRIRFIHFLRMLEEMLEERRHPRTIAGWAEYLRRLLDEMVFEAGVRDDEDHAHFVALIDEMSMLDRWVQVEVGFDVFRHSFLHRLTREQRSRSFLSQGVTFCSMVPMRSIPFRVIAMLGMDYDKFPRRDIGVSFSHLVTGEPLPGDRNVRNNDRHLFLETLLSARDTLYISYCSRDVKDAEVRPPSPLVDELIDYVAKGMSGTSDAEKLRKKWLLQHPLHGFSAAYFKGGPFRNFLPESRFQSGIPVTEGQPRTQVFELAEIDLDALVAFLQNPPKTFLQRQFNVSYYDEEMLLPEHELFELDKLQEHALKQDLLGMESEAIPAYAASRQLAGRLPLHNMGSALTAHIYDGLAGIRGDFDMARGERMPRHADVDIPLSEGRITGRIPGIYDEDLIVVCTSSNHLKYLLAAYVRYLALRASNRDVSLIFITKSLPGLHGISPDAVTPAEALQRLEAFAAHYRSGHHAFFHFHPNLARMCFKMLEGGHEEFMDALEALEDDPNNYDFDDMYLQKAIENGFFSEAAYGSLKDNVLGIMKPIEQLLPALFPKK